MRSLSSVPRQAPRSPGFSLLELLLVVGAMALLLAAGFAIYGKVRLENQVQQELRQAEAIHAAIASTMLGRPISGEGSTLERQTRMNHILVATGVVPRGETALRHAWGGALRVTPILGSFGSEVPCGKDPRGFALQYDHLPDYACARLALVMSSDPSRYCHISASPYNAPVVRTPIWTDGVGMDMPNPGEMVEICERVGSSEPSGLLKFYVGVR